jgi:hypothetical protein
LENPTGLGPESRQCKGAGGVVTALAPSTTFESTKHLKP